MTLAGRFSVGFVAAALFVALGPVRTAEYVVFVDVVDDKPLDVEVGDMVNS